MSANGIVKGTATAGTTHNVATYNVAEGGGSGREIQRTALNDASGNDLTTGSTQTLPSAVTLTTANTTYVLVATGAKVGWLIHNISDTEIYIGFHTSVTTSIGIRIYPGGSYEQRGLGMFTGNVYGVCGSSSKIVRVQTW